METIELAVDESLLAAIDQATRTLSITRNDFARIALELALRNQKTIVLEQLHAQGYAQHAAKSDEFDGGRLNKIGVRCEARRDLLVHIPCPR